MEKSLLEKHINNNLSIRQISDLINLSPTSVRYWIKKFNLKTSFSIKPEPGSKICSKCKLTLPVEDFYQKNKNSLQPYCKSCFNEILKQRWMDRKIWAIQYKGSKCIDCNISYPKTPYQVFDFHHTDPSTKEMDWSQIRLTSKDKMKSELDKCVLLCANCHRIRHIL